jgi:hypothetical protein
MTGPRKGLAEYTAIGVLKAWPRNKSETDPPATLRKAAPDTPDKNLPTSQVSAFLPTATGMLNITKKRYEYRYIWGRCGPNLRSSKNDLTYRRSSKEFAQWA